MNRRVFQYGETRRATVEHVDRSGALVLTDELGEGHILLGVPSDPCEKGDAGTLTFTKGGSMGGYWRFTKEQA